MEGIFCCNESWAVRGSLKTVLQARESKFYFGRYPLKLPIASQAETHLSCRLALVLENKVSVNKHVQKCSKRFVQKDKLHTYSATL